MFRVPKVDSLLTTVMKCTTILLKGGAALKENCDRIEVLKNAFTASVLGSQAVLCVGVVD